MLSVLWLWHIISISQMKRIVRNALKSHSGHQEETKSLQEAINNNTIVMNKLLDRMESETK